MTRRKMTPERYEDIKKMLDLGISTKEISRVKKATRRTIREIRDGILPHPLSNQGSPPSGPKWCSEISWEIIYQEATGNGRKKDRHPLKFIWQEYASDLVGYTCFLDQFYKRHPEFKQSYTVIRDIPMGQQCEVDYMGFMPVWVDQNGKCHSVPIFLGVLCGSQVISGSAKSDARSANFIACHVRMYEDFGGVPAVTVPDCLKTGVVKCNLYDPEINLSYADMAQHYNTAIVPARPGKPKDKPIVEGAVRIVTDLFQWRYRNHVFTSVEEIDQALQSVIREINDRPHSRLGISRREKLEEEKALLGELPAPYEYTETKTAKVHPDCHIALEGSYYSVPYKFVGRTVTVKYTVSQVRVFLELESLAVHKRSLNKKGERITNKGHLPKNIQAYMDATPQKVLEQAKQLNKHLHGFIDGLFKKDTVGNIRRAMGFVSTTKKLLKMGEPLASEIVKAALEHMTKHAEVKLPRYRELLIIYARELSQKNKKTIERQPNELLRYTKEEVNNGEQTVH